VRRSIAASPLVGASDRYTSDFLTMSRQATGRDDWSHRARPRRPVTTYSIVARDASGAVGVAVQSHWFNVGAVVPSVEQGMGAVAVQSISDPWSGPRLLD
jgi:Family of unknown function (DUF1028)